MDVSLLLVAVLVNFVFMPPFNFGTKLVREYLCFYAAAKMAVLRLPLYDRASQMAMQAKLFGHSGLLPFLHAPHELLLFLPLSFLPLPWSLALWRLLSFVATWLAVVILARNVHAGRWIVAALTFGLSAVAFTIFEGQDSLLLLLLLCWSMDLLDRDRPWPAGAVLAVALFRPQIPSLIAIALLVHGQKKLFASFAVSAIVLGALSFLYIGSAGVHDYLSLVNWTEHYEPLGQMPNLRAAIKFLGIHNPAVYGVTASAIVLACVPIWRKSRDVRHVISTAICVGVLAAPHLFAWELSLLAIPLVVFFPRLCVHDWLIVSPLFIGVLFIFLFADNHTPFLAISVVYLAARCCYFAVVPERLAVASFAQ